MVPRRATSQNGDEIERQQWGVSVRIVSICFTELKCQKKLKNKILGAQDTNASTYSSSLSAMHQDAPFRASVLFAAAYMLSHPQMLTKKRRKEAR